MKYNSSSLGEKTQHYKQIKQFFQDDIKKENGYYHSKHNIKQKRIFDLCFRLFKENIDDENEISSAFDAGCGIGYFSFELLNRFPKYNTVVGIDFIPDVIKTANQLNKFPDKNYFIVGDLQKIPCKDCIFDITFCVDTLHHIYQTDFEEALNELSRITKKYLIIEIRNKKNIFNLWYTNIIQPIFFKKLPIYTTSVSDVTKYLKDYNFEFVIAKRIAHSRWSCRRLVLVFKRI